MGQRYRPVKLTVADDDVPSPDSPSSSVLALLAGLATVATTVVWFSSTSPSPLNHDAAKHAVAAAAAADDHARMRLCPPVANTSASSYLILFSGHSGSSAFAEQLTTYPFSSRSVRTAGFEPLEKHNGTAALEWTRNLFETAKRDAGGRSSSSSSSPAYSTGFKMRVDNYSVPDRLVPQWRALLQEHGTRLIWQEDHNPLRDALKGVADSSILCKIHKARTRRPTAECSSESLTNTMSSLQFQVRAATSPLLPCCCLISPHLS